MIYIERKLDYYQDLRDNGIANREAAYSKITVQIFNDANSSRSIGKYDNVKYPGYLEKNTRFM